MKSFIILTIIFILLQLSETTVKFYVETSHLKSFICSKLCQINPFQLCCVGNPFPKEVSSSLYPNPCTSVLCLHCNGCRHRKSFRRALGAVKYYPYYSTSISYCTCPIDRKVLQILKVLFWSTTDVAGRCNAFTRLRIACSKTAFSAIHYECFISEITKRGPKYNSDDSTQPDVFYIRRSRNDKSRDTEVVDDDEEEDDIPEDIAIEEDASGEAVTYTTTEIKEKEEIHQQQVNEMKSEHKNVSEDNVETSSESSCSSRKTSSSHFLVMLLILLINL